MTRLRVAFLQPFEWYDLEGAGNKHTRLQTVRQWNQQGREASCNVEPHSITLSLARVPQPCAIYTSSAPETTSAATSLEAALAVSANTVYSTTVAVYKPDLCRVIVLGLQYIVHRHTRQEGLKQNKVSIFL